MFLTTVHRLLIAVMLAITVVLMSGLVAYAAINALKPQPLTAAEKAALYNPSLYLTPSADHQAVEIRVRDVSNFYSLSLQLQYNPTLVQVTDAEATQAGIQIQTGQAPMPDYIVRNQVDPTTGQIDYVVTQLAPRNAFQGDGLVATIAFDQPINDYKMVSVTAARLVDQNGRQLEVALPESSPEMVNVVP